MLTAYRIEFPDGSAYIGSTVNFAQRRKQHLDRSRRKSPRLQAKFDEYPVCGIYPIASGLSRDTLHELEAQLIEQHQPSLNMLVPRPLPASTRRQRKEPTKPTLTSHAGKTLSVRAWARELGVHPATISLRLKMQMPTHRVLHQGRLEPTLQQRIIRIGDEAYPVNKWAKLRGLKPQDIHRRLNQGWTEREALGFDERPRAAAWREAKERKAQETTVRQEKLLEYQGIRAPLSEHCRRVGAAYSTVYYRLNSGWDVESAFTGKNKKRVFESHLSPEAKMLRQDLDEPYSTC